MSYCHLELKKKNHATELLVQTTLQKCEVKSIHFNHSSEYLDTLILGLKYNGRATQFSKTEVKLTIEVTDLASSS